MDAAAPLSLIQRRIAVAAALCVAAFVLVGVGLVDVTLFSGHESGSAVSHETFAVRADLVDRNGELLARDLPVHDLYAQPDVFWSKAQAAAELAAATGANGARLLRIFASKHRYVLVARQLAPDAQDRVMRLGLPGLEFVRSYKRYYPKGYAAAQVIGVTDQDGNGLTGLELGLGPRLRAPAEGAAPKPVQLSLDMRVQYALAQEVERAHQEFTAAAAGGIVMNVNTGEVLAMVSLPAPGDGPVIDPTSAADPYRNRMVRDDFELGSVFKIFSFAMALENHTITSLDEQFPIGSGFKIGRHTIHDAERMPATLAVRDILGQSSNIGTAQIVLRSGSEKQKAFLIRLGLLSAVRSELPGDAGPLYPSHWGDIQTATIGFGQGISVTPLSFVRGAAEVVNGGRAITPTFLKHPADARGAQLISPETSATMRQLLRYVVTNGTGKSADVPGYDVGGKTGSAQVPGPDGRYLHGALRTSFCAIFPDDNPRYLVFVLLDRPHGTKKTFGFALAGFTAAPLAGRVIARIAPLLGLPPAPVHTVAKENS
ncbi:MAG: penicillin-binding protein 2 [Pseudomonadota bacterium]|nr:penicillin-binding protein 2 [Pseudomonadota bacterium]